MNNKRIIIINSLILISTCLVSLILAYFIKYDDKYNWDLVSLIITNSVVIMLFVTTFTLIDNRNLKKEENKEKTANIVLMTTYNECKRVVEYLTTQVIEIYILPKCDFNKPSNSKENIIFTNFKNLPFVFENQIFDFAKDGIVQPEVFEHYITLKQKYVNYIELRLALFDAPEVYEPLKTELLNEINKHLKADSN